MLLLLVAPLGGDRGPGTAGDAKVGPPALESDQEPASVEKGTAFAAGSRVLGSRSRALLVGINDYDFPTEDPDQPPLRARWSDLRGAVNDVRAAREVLLGRFGFLPEEIEVLEDGAATRQAILGRLDSFLVEPSRAGDRVLFYFSGHGSRLPNATSEEYDGLDETIVPRDSRLGAPDIRDKELRLRFNRILDRGAALTVVLDSCHSGSAERGYPIDGRAKGLEPMRTPSPDQSPATGPAPGERGALVWSAAQDDRNAYETTDEQGRSHGAFTLAWLRAIRDSDPGESVDFLFRRVRGLLLAEARHQEPVLVGIPSVRKAPLLGGPRLEGSGRAVAVERVMADGRIEVQGGWIHGIDVGSRLRLLGRDGEEGPVFEVTEVRGWGRSVAEPISGGEDVQAPIASGDLVEITNRVAPAGSPLRVWIPTREDPASSIDLARQLSASLRDLGWGWVSDPTIESPTHVLRWQGRRWELIECGGPTIGLGQAPTADTVLAHLAQRGKGQLFVHLPTPSALVSDLGLEPGAKLGVVQREETPGGHHYVLVGRLVDERVEYAWLRAGRTSESKRTLGAASLPLRTAWAAWDGGWVSDFRSADSTLQQQGRVFGLARIHAWNALAGPERRHFGYDLSVREARTGAAVDGLPLIEGQVYGLALVRRAAASSLELRRRYVYVFSIDGEGTGTLHYPDPFGGNLQNRLPRKGFRHAPAEIRLGPARLFEATPPFGVDTFFLLTSAEPIDNPWDIFEFEGVHRRVPRPGMTALERFLFSTSSPTRRPRQAVPGKWSLDRYPFEVIPASPPEVDRRGGTGD